LLIYFAFAIGKCEIFISLAIHPALNHPVVNGNAKQFDGKHSNKFLVAKCN